jgi:hypothetical protein
MGGEADDLNAELQRQYKESMELDDAIRQAVRILRRAAPAGSTVSRLEVAADTLASPRPARIWVSRPPKEWPMIAACCAARG